MNGCGVREQSRRSGSAGRFLYELGYPQVPMPGCHQHALEARLTDAVLCGWIPAYWDSTSPNLVRPRTRNMFETLSPQNLGSRNRFLPASYELIAIGMAVPLQSGGQSF